MRSRAVQLAVLIVLGAIIVLLIQRPWNRNDVVPDVAAVNTPLPASAPPPAQPHETDVAAPAAGSFKLPAMPKPLPDAKPAPESTDPVLVPKDWILRGTGPQNYDLKIVRDEVFSGQVSVRLASRVKDVPMTQFASLMQSVSADPWLGKRALETG